MLFENFFEMYEIWKMYNHRYYANSYYLRDPKIFLRNVLKYNLRLLYFPNGNNRFYAFPKEIKKKKDR